MTESIREWKSYGLLLPIWRRVKCEHQVGVHKEAGKKKKKELIHVHSVDV